MVREPDYRTQKTQKFRRERKKYFCGLFCAFCETFASSASGEPEPEYEPYAR
jgi:hypothetical protein